MEGMIIKDEQAAYYGRLALSNSGMGELLRCPAHLKAMLDRCGQDDKTNDAFTAGSLLHCMVLEPSEVSSRYRVKVNRGNTKAGKEEAEKAAEDGVQLVSQDMWETCSAMADAALRHPVMRSAHAAGDLRTEQSVYWTERGGTVPCKARVDALVTLPNYGLCAIDLKTTRDASLAAIEKSLYTYGYHRQAAWYLRGLRSAARSSSCSSKKSLRISLSPPIFPKARRSLLSMRSETVSTPSRIAWLPASGPVTRNPPSSN